MLQKQHIRCSTQTMHITLKKFTSVYGQGERGNGQGERDENETLTNSWGMHLANKVLFKIKNPSEITEEKNYNFDQEFRLP